jgi:acyl-ACP thioesterase
MYSLKYKVTTSTCDSEGRLKLFSALQMMQDCSEMWIDTEPAVKEYFERENMAQLLASRQVEIVRVPRYKESLYVETSVWGMKSMFGFRNTFIYDAEGQPCYRTWSQGAFVNKATGRLAKVSDEVASQMEIVERKPMTYLDRRIILPKDQPLVEHPAVLVQRNDIDYNRHMNNANYVRLAMELLPEDFEVKGMRVEYKIPAKLGNELIPQTIETADAFYVQLMLDGRVSTVIELTNEGGVREVDNLVEGTRRAEGKLACTMPCKEEVDRRSTEKIKK